MNTNKIEWISINPEEFLRLVYKEFKSKGYKASDESNLSNGLYLMKCESSTKFDISYFGAFQIRNNKVFDRGHIFDMLGMRPSIIEFAKVE